MPSPNLFLPIQSYAELPTYSYKLNLKLKTAIQDLEQESSYRKLACQKVRHYSHGICLLENELGICESKCLDKARVQFVTCLAGFAKYIECSESNFSVFGTCIT